MNHFGIETICHLLWKDSHFLVIIEPFWNWNMFLLMSWLMYLLVIIEPFWNWNSFWRLRLLQLMSNNWTILELKHGMQKLQQAHENGNNWTILELKLYFCRQDLFHLLSNNWTILELKHDYELSKTELRWVIIEPFWNWNPVNDSAYKFQEQ